MDSKYFFLVQLFLAYSLKITGLIIGYYLIKAGKQLLADGIKGKFKFKVKIGNAFLADLQSALPGLLFVVLGSLLIAFSIFVKKEFKYSENTPNNTDAEFVTTPNSFSELDLIMPEDTLK